MKVRDLVGGDIITLPGMPPATFSGRSDHPKYRGLALVVWVLGDNTVSLDALSFDQEVGELSSRRADDGWDTRLTTALVSAVAR